jgi:uncharacterized Zn finger protein (UPF0148 family)
MQRREKIDKKLCPDCGTPVNFVELKGRRAITYCPKCKKTRTRKIPDSEIANFYKEREKSFDGMTIGDYVQKKGEWNE